MRLRDHYDWIVIGNHPGAVFSAGLVAKLGFSVLVLPSGVGHRKTFSRSYLDEESNFLLGSYSTPGQLCFLARCFQAFQLPFFDDGLIYPGFPQVLTPQIRLSLGSPSDLKYELERELGKTRAQRLGWVEALEGTEADFNHFWETLLTRLKRKANGKIDFNLKKDLDDLNLRWRRSLRKKEGLDFSEKNGSLSFSELVRGMEYGTTGGFMQHLDSFHLLYSGHLARTAGSFEGGMKEFRQSLLKMAENLGAHILSEALCRRIFVERGHFAGIQVETRENVISGRAGILGCSLERAYRGITQTGRAWAPRMKKVPKPVGWKLTAALTVHPEAIPERIGSRTIWQEEGAPPIEIELALPSKKDGVSVHEKVLFIRTVMPYHPESLKTEIQRTVIARMIRQVLEIIPFLEFHITQIYPYIRFSQNPIREFLGTDATQWPALGGASDQDEVAQLYSFKSLDEIPDHWILREGQGVGSDSGVKNLYVSSDESYPELGSLGGMIACMESIAALAAQHGMPDPFGTV